MNVPILITQIAFLIINKKYDDAVDRIDSIEKYCARHLRKKNDTFRSDCFIKVLMQIPVFGFDRKRIARESGILFDKLQSVPIEMANQPYELEIIPYEHMWDYILSSL